jgi:hypothetical protein
MIIVLCMAGAWLAKTYKNICWTLLEDIVHDLCHILGKSSICRCFVRFVCMGNYQRWQGIYFQSFFSEVQHGTNNQWKWCQEIMIPSWTLVWGSRLFVGTLGKLHEHHRGAAHFRDLILFWWEKKPELKELVHGFWTFLKRCREMSGNLDLVIRIY